MAVLPWIAPLASARCLICAALLRYNVKSLVKQSSLDDPFDGGLDRDDDLMREMEGLKTGSDDDIPPTPPRPATPSVVQKSLPWKPKVR